MNFLDAETTQSMMEKGEAVLVDIREDNERARARIPGSRHAPLSQMKVGLKPEHDGKAVIFHCASEMRTRSAAALLKSSVPGASYILIGGISGWNQAGLPVEGSGGGDNPLLQLMAKMPWARPAQGTASN